MLSRFREWRGVWLALSIAVAAGIALVLSVGKIYSPAVIGALNGSMKTEFNEKVLSSLATFDPEYFVTALAWSPDGKYLAASVNGDVRVLIFDVESREVVKSEWKPTTGGRSISFTPEGEYILTPSSNYPDGKNDYSLILIDRHTGAFLQRVEGPYPGDRSFARRNVASKFALSPDHKWLLAAVDLRNPGLALYDLVTLTVTKTIPFPKGADGIAWRPDSQAVAIMAGVLFAGCWYQISSSYGRLNISIRVDRSSIRRTASCWRPAGGDLLIDILIKRLCDQFPFMKARRSSWSTQQLARLCHSPISR